MSSGKKGYALVTQYIRKLRGGSQPVLVQASDGLLYVAKFTSNPQGPNIPFNESIGTELYRACRLPVPSWKPLLITDSFLDKNPACWIETPEGRLRPDPGLCFGSRLLGENGSRLWEVLPCTSLQRVRNQAAFWFAWLLDICAEHADNRQAIFAADAEGRLKAYFVDHGHLFGGPTGKDQPHFRASKYLDPRIYRDLSYQYVSNHLDILKSLNVDKLWNAVVGLPDDWKTVSAVTSLGRSLGRLSKPTLLCNLLDTIIHDHGHREQRECRAFPESVLCTGLQTAAITRSAFGS